MHKLFLSSPVKPESNGALPVHFSSVVFNWRRRKRWRVVSHVETYRTKFISSLSLIWQTSTSPLTDFPSIDWKDRDGMQSRDGDGKVVCVFLTLSGGKEVFERGRRKITVASYRWHTGRLLNYTTHHDQWRQGRRFATKIVVWLCGVSLLWTKRGNVKRPDRRHTKRGSKQTHRVR